MRKKTNVMNNVYWCYEKKKISAITWSSLSYTSLLLLLFQLDSFLLHSFSYVVFVLSYYSILCNSEIKPNNQLANQTVYLVAITHTHRCSIMCVYEQTTKNNNQTTNHTHTNTQPMVPLYPVCELTQKKRKNQMNEWIELNIKRRRRRRKRNHHHWMNGWCVFGDGGGGGGRSGLL